MSDTSQGPGWWQASDGKWYPPEQAPGATPPAGPPAGAPMGAPMGAAAQGNLADWGTRASSYVIDYVALGILGSLISNTVSVALGSLVSLLALAFGIYNAYLNGATGRSVGKKVIGTMVVSEEITALETMALKPARLVAAPRILAVTLMVPCVTLVGDVIGIYGGRLVAGGVLEIGANTYWEQVWMQLTTENIRDGFVKSIVFGLLVGLVGCYKGFRARGGAEGVGRATTSSVVTAIVAILIADGILNYLMLFRL